MAVENDHIAGGEMSSAAQPVASSVSVPARRFRYSAEVAPASVAALEGGANSPIGGINWTRIWIAFAAAAACFIALYPSELGQLGDRWYSDAGWSHGFVVPLISLFFVRLKWEQLRQLVPKVSWMGFVILLVGVFGQVLFRATGTLHMSNLSILVLLFGVVLFVFGWEYMKLLWLPIGYLIFALPPPNALYVKMTTPMQIIASELGVILLPLFGGTGSREGTTIHVTHGSTEIPLNVAEACSGMRMLVAFLALAVALGYSTSRPVWQKITLALFALPIAIVCNAFRVTITGIIGAAWGLQYAQGSTHETLGLLMLIPALGMQLGAAWLLDRLFIDDGKPPAGASAGGCVMSDISRVNAEVSPRLNRLFFMRALAVCGVIAAGAVTMKGLEKALNLTFDKPPMELSKPLDKLKSQLGTPVRYLAGMNEPLDADTVETLGTNKYLVRHYTDITKRPGELGSDLVLNMNYYDRGSAAPHVPEICWTDNGLVEAGVSRRDFVIENVPHKRGPASALHMTMISFLPTQEESTRMGRFTDDPNNRLKNVAYCFEVNGTYVPTPAAVMSNFWHASYKYAYETKIEVTVTGFSSQAEAQKLIGDFMQAAIPEIEECLPDPARLTDAPPTPAAADASPVDETSSTPNKRQ